MFGIYDGDDSGETAPAGFIPAGSAQIEDVFEAFYAARDLPSQDSEFSGRSDYGPFIAVGIPAGGLFTGAEVHKTAAEAAQYGGVAGAAYDPCYHAFCDNLTGDGQPTALYDQLREDYDPDRQHQHGRAGRELGRGGRPRSSRSPSTPRPSTRCGHPGRGLVKAGEFERTMASAHRPTRTLTSTR